MRRPREQLTYAKSSSAPVRVTTFGATSIVDRRFTIWFEG